MLHRLAWAAGGALTGVLVVAFSAAPVDLTAVLQGHPELVSDVDGELAEVEVQYVRSFHDQAFPTLADFLGALPESTAVRVVVADAEEFDFLMAEMERAGVRTPAEVTAVVTGFPVTPWAKDRFGTLRRGRTAVLAVPPERSRVGGARGNDERVPDVLCDHLDGVECQALPFRFEGGDLLSDDERVYVAATLLGRNPALDEDELMSRIRDTFGKEIVRLGHSPADVPDHHIGMVVTPLGDGVVAVADPDLGRDLIRALTPVGSEPVDGGATVVAIEETDEAYLPFRRVIADLEEQGLRVVRVPMLLTDTPRVYVTYNNAVLETRRDGGHVYLPVYGLEELDALAMAAFEGEGWTVHPVRVADLYRHTGSLRCQVGVIRRI